MGKIVEGEWVNREIEEKRRINEKPSDRATALLFNCDKGECDWRLWLK